MSEGIGYEANLQRGQLLRQSGRFEDACRFLGEAIQADPEQSQAYVELALAQSELPGKKADSLRSIERAVTLTPHSARVIGYRAYLLSHFGRHREGLEIGKRALELDPECYIALLAHANAYTKLSQWKEAETFSRRILAHYPDDSSARNLLAQALRFQNRSEESRQIVSQILAQVPNDTFGHTNAGYEALNVNDFRRAEDHFRNALSRDPTFEHARRGLLQTFRMRSWYYRANLQVLNFFEGKSGWPVFLKVVMVFLCFMTFGIFFGIILLYLATALTLSPLSNLFLLFNPTARRTFNAVERRRTWFTGVATGSILTGLGFNSIHLFLVAFIYLALFCASFYLPGWIDALRSQTQSKSPS
jgi:tetratricopeptide (TPR) repeat protein